ncbi:MAG: (2Fe-2S)-binding protein [Planctomycetes bacterium]|nr:(2Fe-2S)-binding protein [Planctomycetota bacterium]
MGLTWKRSTPDELVCCCFKVSRRRLEAVIRTHRLRTVEEVTRLTGGCGGCQTCRADIEAMLARREREGE